MSAAARTMLPPADPDAPTAICVGPHSRTGAPTIEVAFMRRRTISIILDPAHAHAFARRLRECADGTVTHRPLAQRVLEVELAEATEDDGPREPLCRDCDDTGCAECRGER